MFSPRLPSIALASGALLVSVAASVVAFAQAPVASAPVSDAGVPAPDASVPGTDADAGVPANADAGTTAAAAQPADTSADANANASGNASTDADAGAPIPAAPEGETASTTASGTDPLEEVPLETLGDESLPGVEPDSAALPAQAPPAVNADEPLVLRGGTIILSAEDVFRSGGSVAAIDERELRRLGYSDPNNVVQRVPGVAVRNEDGFGLRPNIGIRGTNPERSRGITLMEDGVLFGPAPYSAPAAYYFPLVSRMVGVSVYKGPSAILYGPATTGGAIDFTSRDVPLTPGGSAQFSYGSYGSRLAHLHYGASNRRAGFLFEGIDLGSRGYKEIDGDPNAPTGFSKSEFMLRGFVQSRTTRHVYHRLSTKLMYTRERSNETYLGLTDADFRANPDRRYLASSLDLMRNHRMAYELTHRLEVGSRISLTTTLYRHDYARVWHRFDSLGPGAPSAFSVLSDPSSPVNQVYYDILTGNGEVDPSVRSNRIVLANNDRKFVSEGVQSTLRFEATTGRIRHQLEAGVRVHYDQIRRYHTGESYLPINHTLVRDGSQDVVTKNERAGALAIATHAMYGMGIGRVRITPGVRTEFIRTLFDDYMDGRSERTWQNAVLGGLGTTVAILPWLNGFAGVHRGFAPVAPGQRANVKHEASTNVELGFRARNEAKGIRAEIAGFVNDYSNLLLTCAGSGGCAPEDIDRQFNAGAVVVAGLESSYAHELRLGSNFTLPLRASYGFMRSRFRSDFISGDPQYTSVKVGDEVPYLPHHQATFEVGLEHGRFGVRATGTIVGRMREQAGSGDVGAFTDRYAILDVMGEVELRPRIHVTLRLENVTNSRPIVAHRPIGARPYRPFMAMAGIRFDL